MERPERKADRGVIFLMGSISESRAENVCREIISLNMEGDKPFIQMIINCAGGYVHDGFAIIDMMEWSRLPVYTTGVGLVASMGLLIFCSGEKGHRVLTPRTSVLSHRYSTMKAGNYSQIVASRDEEDFMHKRAVNHYIQHSKLKNEKEVNDILLKDVDTWLTPKETVELGLADFVQEDSKQPYPKDAPRGKEKKP